MAILRYRLYDIDRLINRTLVYGLLTALLAGVYGGAVLVLGQVFGGVGVDPPSWVVAGATLAVAALFQPARRRIQAVVGRRFNRRKDNPPRTIQPTRASLWLRPSTPDSGRKAP
jgi:membrane protein implicated in regulation of membrane protease activity